MLALANGTSHDGCFSMMIFDIGLDISDGLAILHWLDAAIEGGLITGLVGWKGKEAILEG